MSAFTITPLSIAATPLEPMVRSPDISTGLYLDPSPIKAAPLVFVAITRSSPDIVKSPAMVKSAPLNVAAVVGLDPDFKISSPLLFVMEPNVVPASFNNMSAPSASMMISPGASKVTFVAPFDMMSKVVVPSSFIVTFASSASKMFCIRSRAGFYFSFCEFMDQ